MHIGEHIRSARKAAKLSQENLARQAGVTMNLVSRLERGEIRDPHYSTLSGIADSLGVSVTELLEEETGPKVQAPPSPEPEQGRRAPVLTEAVITTVDKWTSIASDPDINEWKSSGIADAASALGHSIEDIIERADGVSWESLPSREQHEIMQVMEKVTEVLQSAYQRVKDDRLEEEFSQRREKIREWTQRISA